MQTLFARHYLATAITLAILPASALATTLDTSSLALIQLHRPDIDRDRQRQP